MAARRPILRNAGGAGVAGHVGNQFGGQLGILAVRVGGHGGLTEEGNAARQLADAPLPGDVLQVAQLRNLVEGAGCAAGEEVALVAGRNDGFILKHHVVEELHARDGLRRIDLDLQVIRPEVAAEAAHERREVHLGTVGKTRVIDGHVAVHAGLFLDGLHALTEGFPRPRALGHIFVRVLQTSLLEQILVIDHDKRAGGERNGVDVVAVAPQAQRARVDVVRIIIGQRVVQLGAQARADERLDVAFHDPECVGRFVALQIHQQQAAVFRAGEGFKRVVDVDALFLRELIHKRAEQRELRFVARPGRNLQLDRVGHCGGSADKQKNGKKQANQFLHGFDLLFVCWGHSRPFVSIIG